MKDSTNRSDNIKWIYRKSQMEYYGSILSNRLFNRDIIKYKKHVLSGTAGNNELLNMIESEVPFAAIRYGETEARTIADVLYTKSGGRFGGLNDKTISRIVNHAGFFPANREQLYELADLYVDCTKDADIIGVWNVMMQEYLADDIAKSAKLAELRMLEPYYHDNPWSYALKGKKVVVVHPFAELIQDQYSTKRETLFNNKHILPEFDLRTVKAVQTIAGHKDSRFDTWFDALEYMYDEVMNEGFDTALIGCGAYGLPLAIKIKRAGKQAVHMGGSLQILFGIKGKRWDNHDFISKLYNDFWVRPGKKEHISGSEAIENSCYW